MFVAGSIWPGRVYPGPIKPGWCIRCVDNFYLLFAWKECLQLALTASAPNVFGHLEGYKDVWLKRNGFLCACTPSQGGALCVCVYVYVYYDDVISRCLLHWRTSLPYGTAMPVSGCVLGCWLKKVMGVM